MDKKEREWPEWIGKTQFDREENAYGCFATLVILAWVISLLICLIQECS